MEFYITQCIAGFIAFDENLQIAKYKLFKEDEIVTNLLKIEENEILDEEIELIGEITLDECGDGDADEASDAKAYELYLRQSVCSCRSE